MIQGEAATVSFSRGSWADPVPDFLPERGQGLDGADHDLEFGHFAGLIEFDERSMPLELPFGAGE
jgi:hypothetical protein